MSIFNCRVKHFIVIDTEGSDVLREIAIIDSEGKTIYEAFTNQNSLHQNKLNTKSLEKIVEELEQILPQTTIVCHNTEHDQKILRNSFPKCRKIFPSVEFICTLKLAIEIYPKFSSYSLKNLSRKLFLKVDNCFFQENRSHSARYDAQFTLQLYQHLISKSNQSMPSIILKQPPISNPFSSNRVDNPFQNHLDFQNIYQSQFNHLKSLVEEIKNDSNQQSKAAVVIGEAGSGKTHLMMRLAKATLKTNRLLYVRQPNNPQSVIHHIYARILESFSEKINLANGNHTQLELLLARSFTSILEFIRSKDVNKKLDNFIQTLKNDNLVLYERLGSEGTQKNRDGWKYIETKITQWWANNYSASGYAPNILKGIIKFCSYKDNPTAGINYKDKVRRWLAGSELDSNICQEIGLNNWQEDLGKEDFALEAIRLFGQLSTLDEPLIIVFDQLEYLIHYPELLISFGNAVREILTQVPNSLIIVNLFPDRWQKFQNSFDASVTDRLSANSIILNRPSHENLTKILAQKCETVNVKLENLFTPSELQIILEQPSIRKVINKASDYYRSKFINIPSGKSNLNPQKTISVEERLTKLENAISQISKICSSLIGENPSTDSLLDSNNLENTKNIENSFVSNEFLSSGVDNLNFKKPIITNYLEENKQILEQDYSKPHIITDDDDYGKLFTIIKAFQEYDSNIEMDHLALGKKVIPLHFLIINNDVQCVIAFLHISGTSFTSRIKNFNQLVISYPKIKFYLLRDEREGIIKSKVGKLEIEKLNYTKNGIFMTMNFANRVNFELIYKMIVDINQGDLEVSLSEAVATFVKQDQNYWLIQELLGKK